MQADGRWAKARAAPSRSRSVPTEHSEGSEREPSLWASAEAAASAHSQHARRNLIGTWDGGLCLSVLSDVARDEVTDDRQRDRGRDAAERSRLRRAVAGGSERRAGRPTLAPVPDRGRSPAVTVLFEIVRHWLRFGVPLAHRTEQSSGGSQPSSDTRLQVHRRPHGTSQPIPLLAHRHPQARVR